MKTITKETMEGKDYGVPRYLIKVCNGNTRVNNKDILFWFKIINKVTGVWRRSGVFIVKVQQISTLFWFFHCCFEQIYASWVES